MRYRSVALTVLCCSAVFALVALRLQSAPRGQRPYVTVSKQTIYIAEPGKAEVVKDIIPQTEARDRQGRRYSSAPSNLPPQLRYDWIRDVVDGRSYQVNRQKKLAYYTTLSPMDSVPDLAKSEMQAVEINGVGCLRGPARQVKPDGGTEVIGTTCIAFDLGNLVVHEDVRVNLGGENLHLVTELEQFQMDSEPPSEWYRIPEDFQLVLGEPGKPAPQK